MRFSWANHSERRTFLSNFSVTCHSVRETHTLDWFLHVCALPENGLRRRHVLKYTIFFSAMNFVPTFYHDSDQVSLSYRDIGR